MKPEDLTPKKKAPKAAREGQEIVVRDETARWFLDSNNLPMFIDLVGITHPHSDYHVHRNISNLTVMEYVSKGSGYVQWGGRWEQVTEGMIYILPKGVTHDYGADSHNPWEKRFINIRGDLPLHLLKEYGLSGHAVFDGTDCAHLFFAIDRVLNEPIPAAETQAMLTGMFMQVLTVLSQNNKRQEHHREAAAMREYLDENIHRVVNNSELSELVFRSVDCCLKRFAKEYNVTPYEYQLQNKMRLACRLLTETDMTVRQIAESVGYPDARYFSTLFRHRCGESPSVYRRKSRS